MLPSMRNFLKHIDLEDDFASQGYLDKVCTQANVLCFCAQLHSQPGALFKFDTSGPGSCAFIAELSH